MKRRNKIKNFKRGPLSFDEKKKVGAWIDLKEDEEIARILNRPIKQVINYKNEYLANAPAILAKRTEAEEYRGELHAEIDWEMYQKELTTVEAVFFERDYIRLRQQLKDISPMEQKQLYQVIMIDILTHRIHTDRMKNQQDIDRLERLLKDEYAKGSRTDVSIAAALETNLQACRSTSTARTKEYKDLLDKSGTIMRDLKSTRDQRIKHLEDRGKFITLLKELEMEDRRKSIGEMVGLMDLAIVKEKDRLSDYHEYADGVIDRPLLTPEIVSDSA